jgi:glyoxylase-like metal-dependent hydrolase (beta-lactamase superfamily II)
MKAITTELLKENLLLIQQTAWTVNLTAIDTPDGVIVVDSFPTPADAELALAEIQTKFEKPVVATINTHHHYDHVLGNQVFSTDRIYAHKKCKERMELFQSRLVETLARRQKMLEYIPTYPTDLLEKSITIEVGGVQVDILYEGPMHTDNDLLVHIPDRKVLIMGDAHVPNTVYPINLRSGSDVANWADVLRRLESRLPADTLIIPGHLAPQTTESLGRQADYLDHLLHICQKSLDNGDGWREASEAEWLHPSSEYLHFRRFHRKNIKATCDYLCEKNL